VFSGWDSKFFAAFAQQFVLHPRLSLCITTFQMRSSHRGSLWQSYFSQGMQQHLLHPRWPTSEHSAAWLAEPLRVLLVCGAKQHVAATCSKLAWLGLGLSLERELALGAHLHGENPFYEQKLLCLPGIHAAVPCCHTAVVRAFAKILSRVFMQ
jgi:hypothetical protein